MAARLITSIKYRIFIFDTLFWIVLLNFREVFHHNLVKNYCLVFKYSLMINFIKNKAGVWYSFIYEENQYSNKSLLDLDYLSIKVWECWLKECAITLEAKRRLVTYLKRQIRPLK